MGRPGKNNLKYTYNILATQSFVKGTHLHTEGQKMLKTCNVQKPGSTRNETEYIPGRNVMPSLRNMFSKLTISIIKHRALLFWATTIYHNVCIN